MSEDNVEPEAQPSTSRSNDVQVAEVIPVVTMPKVVLTRLDMKNLPVPVKSPDPVKTSVKGSIDKNKSTKPGDIQHVTRGRGRPKKNYKVLAETGKFPEEETKVSPSKTGKIGKRVTRLTEKEDNSVRGMLKKTMLQKRSKVVIPPAKKPKLAPKKASKENILSPKLKKETNKASTPLLKKDLSSILKNTLSQMDTDASEDEFLYDELIDELVNPPNKKGSGTEKTTNITLKPNAGNKPPTIVKGGIVKKSSLPPDLKAVASPTTLNSSKLTGTSLNSKVKTVPVENTIEAPATAESPKASLPTKASPFPLSLNTPSVKTTEPMGQGKKSGKQSAKVESSLNIDTSAGPSTQIQISPKPKPVTPAPRPRGRPKLGPKQYNFNKTKQDPIVPTVAADDESDEYTEIETLENFDSDPQELPPNPANDSTKTDDIQVINQISPGGRKEPSNMNTNKDGDPHLDLLRILTGDVEDTRSEANKSKEVRTENTTENIGEDQMEVVAETPDPSNHPGNRSPEKSNNVGVDNPGKEVNASLGSQPNKHPTVRKNGVTTEKGSDARETAEPVVESTPPVRTIYDLMNDVSLQHPSWNLHIIPETNAFCIAQVTKGRLGLPTLKKCIELDAETYNAKVYIHQYHIKRFDGVYDSEEAILALIEEIHNIKA